MDSQKRLHGDLDHYRLHTLCSFGRVGFVVVVRFSFEGEKFLLVGEDVMTRISAKVLQSELWLLDAYVVCWSWLHANGLQ